MRVLSKAFCRLKAKLPNIPADTKLSKLDTLRLAIIYIQQLKALLDGEPADILIDCQNLVRNTLYALINQCERMPLAVFLIQDAY